METKNLLQRNGVVFLLAIFCCALWGSAFPSIKIGYESFGIPSNAASSQILFAGCRFTLAGIMTILMGSALQRQWLLPSRSSLPKIFKVSLFQTILQYFFFYIGLAHTSGVKSSIINSTSTFVAILVSSLLFHQEKLQARKLIGCAVGFLGVVLINLTGSGLDMDMAWNGEGFILLTAVAYAISSVLIKEYGKTENPVMISGWQFTFGGLVMILGGIAMGGHLTVQSAGALWILLYLAFISAAAYSVWSLLLKYNPISKVTVYGFSNPIFGVILSAVFLHEDSQIFNMRSLIALVLVCVGIFIVNYERRS